MIGIIDYGMGNLHSVQKALERLGYASRIVEKEEELLASSALILPGVGAFGDAMNNLKEKKLLVPIQKAIKGGIPFLGICLGMQLLFDTSEEHGYHRGLGILNGHVRRFKGDFKIPHMGWNELIIKQKHHELFEEMDEGHVYFVHSYFAEVGNKEVLLATTDYYGDVPAIVGYKNVIGMQFHPEKSGELGMKLLKRFAKWSERK